MSALQANPFLFAGGDSEFAIERSLRFNSGDSAYLNRTPSSAGNRKTWTWSGWVKKSVTGNVVSLFGVGTNSTNLDAIDYQDESLRYTRSTGGSFLSLKTNAVFRDPSAWYHVVVAVDTTQATAANRVKIYVNGTQETSFSSSSYPSQNEDTFVNSTNNHTIGRRNIHQSDYFDGYIAETALVDGSQLDPTSFGAFDTNGVWQAIDTAGLTFGTNGFRLKFADNSSNAALGTDSSGNSNTWSVNNLTAAAPSTATITHARIYASYGGGTRGANYSVDYSDNGSSWTTAFTGNMTASGCGLITGTGVGNGSYGAHKYWRYVIGSATNDHHPNSARYVLSDGTTDYNVVVYYADNCNDQGNFQSVDRILTFPVNPEGVDSLVDTPTNGDQTDTGAGNEVVGNYCTLNPLAMASGLSLSNGNLDAAGAAVYGCVTSTIFAQSGKYYFEFTLNTYQNDTAPGVVSTDANPHADYLGAQASSVGYLADGRVFQSGSATSYSSYAAGDVIGVAFDVDTGKIWFAKNNTWLNSGDPAAGTNQVKTITGGKPLGAGYRGVGSGAGSFNFGQRAFAYTAPTNFKALNTSSLPTPTIADGSKYFAPMTYTGTFGGGTVTSNSVNFTPDFAWVKRRNAGEAHKLYDVVRGTDGTRYKSLSSNTTGAEVSGESGITAFVDGGFTSEGGGHINSDGQPFVSWLWDAGTSTVTNNDGSIASQVRAQPSAGFSIVSYTGTGSATTVGHGLNAAPSFIIAKRRQVNDWWVYHRSAGASKRLILNLTNSAATNNGIWNGTDPTSSVFSLGNSESNTSGGTYIAYCFAPVAGYSSMGSYQGNGNADGPFVFTGFKVAWLLVRPSSTTGNWAIIDTARDPYNTAGRLLLPNDASAEIDFTSSYPNDFLSNGFKVRNTGGQVNASGTTYIYLAFASNPFQANGGLAR